MSLLVDNCLKYMVGLSRTECSCDYYAACGDFDESLSGLYIDELSPLNTVIIKEREDCEKGTICELMDVARSNAIKNFKADIYGLVMRNYTINRPRFKGSIGGKLWETLLNTNSYVYNVDRMYFKNVVGGTMSITGIWAGFDTTHNFTLSVYNNLGELVTTQALSAVANTWNQNTVSIELPAHSDFIENLEYFFVYATGAANPFDNEVQGGCRCNVFNCNCSYRTQTNKQFGYKQWLLYNGSQKNDLNFKDWDVTGTDYMYGLIFDVDIKCDVEHMLCQNNIDFGSSPVALPIAHAIRYRAGMELVDLILSNPELKRANLINRELMIEYRQEFKQEYKRLMYFDRDEPDTGAIEKGLVVTDSDCFACKDNWGFNKVGILS